MRVLNFGLLVVLIAFTFENTVFGSSVDVQMQSAPFLSEYGAVRWRSFGDTGGSEMFLGVPDLGVGANRVEQGFTWNSPSVTAVTFSYDATTNQLSSSVGGQSPLTFQVSPTNGPSALQIGVADRTAGTSVALENVELNGIAAGDFGGTGEFSFWTVTGVDFTQSWTLTGDVSLNGAFTNSQELSRIDLTVGSVVPEPASTFCLGVVLIGALSRKRRSLDK